MINSKQRAKLRSLASLDEDVAIIGKNGLEKKVIDSIRQVLTARELIKIRVLNSCDNSPRELADELSEMLNAEVVSVIGTKFVLYKKSDKKGIKHIEI